MAELVALFLDELEDATRALHKAWREGNAAELRWLSQRVKGAAGCVGSPEITHTAAALENALLSEEVELASLAEQFEDLIRLCRDAARNNP